jgi:predicted secreted Zn-dependent protease
MILHNPIVSGSLTLSSNATFTANNGTVSGSTQIISLLPSGVVSGSIQVNADTIANFDTNVRDYIRSLDVVSGSSQLTTEFDTRYLNTTGDGVISGSSQISLSGFNTSQLSENTNLYYTDARVKTKLNAETVVSGSSQITKTKSDVGLGNVDNESKATMFSSPALTGNPTAPTQADNDNSTKIATTAYVQREVSDLLGGAPAAFDTLLEISASIANGDSDVVALTTTVGTKLAKASNLSDLANAGTARTNLGVANTQNISEHSSNLYYTDTRVKTKLNSETVISGSSQVNANTITNFDTNVRDYVRSIDVISGSSQVVLNDADKTGFNTADVSEVASNLYYTDARVKTKLNAETVVSGSTQIITLVGVDEDNMSSNSATKFPSQQSVKAYVDAQVDTKDALSELSGDTDDVSEGSNNLYYTDGRVKTKLNAEGVVSSSAQVQSLGGVNNPTITLTAGAGLDGGGAITLNQSGNETITFTVADGVISGSTQVDYDSIQNQPTTISSAQGTKLGNIAVTQAVNLDTMESNITTNNNKVGYTDALVKTKLNAETVISGSAQLVNTFLEINGDGVVSGSVTRTINSETPDASGDVSLDTSTISEHSSNKYYTDTRVQNYVRSNDVISGSNSVVKDFLAITESDISDLSHYTDANVKTKLNAETVVSGSSQVDYDNIQNQPTTITSGQASKIGANHNKVGYTDALVKTKLNAETVVSGSSQIDVTATTNYSNINQYTDSNFDTRLASKSTANLSEGSNLYYTDTRVRDYVRSIDVISGSAQLANNFLEINGDSVFSSSAQIDHDSTTNFVAGEHFTQGNITTVGTVTSGNVVAILPSGTISGSSQVSISLGSQTSGTYVSRLGTGTGVTIGSNSGEGSVPTIGVNYGATANTATQGNTTITLNGTTNEIDITGNTSQALGGGPSYTLGLADSIAGNRTFENNVTISGDLVINGATTTAATTNTTISDKLIELGNGTTGAPAGDSGIVIERGDAANAFIGFDESADKFVVGTGAFVGSSTGNLSITKGTLLANVEGTLLGDVTGEVSSISNHSTADLTEHSTNLYYTDTRVQSYLRSNDVISGSSQIGGLSAGQLTDNSIEINGVDVELGDSITFAALSNGTGTISGSAQLTTEFDSRYINSNGDGVISGSSQVDATSVTNFDTNVQSFIRATDVISGSSQIDVTATTNYSSINQYTDSDTTALLRSSDVISGSSQVDVTATTNYSGISQYTNTKVRDYIRSIDVVSGSSQLLSDLDGRYLEINGDSVVSQSAQIDYNSIQNQPTTITAQQATDIGNNNNKATNVSTDLSITGTSGARTIASSDGTNAIIPIATTSVSGLLSPGLFDEIDANTAKVTYTDTKVRDYIRSIDVISGSSQLTTDLDGRYLEINGDSVVSQSAQIDYNSIQNQPTIPSAASNATITLTAGTDLGTGGNFTTNQSSNETITINHSNVSRSDTTSTGAPSYGGTFTAVDSVTTSARGHVTALNVKTITIPSSDDTAYNLNVQAGASNTSIIRLAGSDSTNDDVTLSGGTGITISESGNVITITGTAQYGDSDVQDFIRSIDVISGSAGILAAVSVDEDNFSSNSATKLPTQQSVKAYVDSKAQAQDNTDELTEGSSNLFFTNARVDSRMNSEDVVSGSATQVRSFLNIENGANVTDTANVTAAGALMDTEVTNLAAVKAFDGSNYLASSVTTITSTQAGHITTNNDKVSNVSTDLSITGTAGARTITSSDGTNAVIPIATTSVSGLLSPGLFDEIDANTAKTSDINHNVSTNLSEGTSTTTTVDVNSSDGNNATLVSASTSRAGLLTKAKFDEIVANSLKTSDINHNVSTDLGISGTTGARTITSSDGNNAVIPLATTSVSGLLSPSLFDEIDANTAKTGITTTQAGHITTNNDKVSNVSTDLGISGTTGARTITSSDGSNAIIPIATTSVSGVMSKAIFDEHVANNAKNTDVNHNVSTNLSKSTSETNVTINSSDGDNIAIGAASTSVAGVMTKAMFDKLDGIETSADVNRTAAQMRTAIGTGNGNLVPAAGSSGEFLKHDGTFGTPSYIANTHNNDVSVANLKTRLGSSFASNAVSIGDSNDTVTIPGDLVVTGTTTTNNVEVVSTTNGVVFEGSAADAHEGTLLAGTLSADRTYTLPNKTGTVAITTDITGTNSNTNTGDETTSRINALDITEVGTISSGVWNGTAITTTYLSGQSGTNSGDETKTRINALNITEVGTITSGVWNGTAITSANLDADTAHLSGTQTFSGAKTFSSSTASTSKTTGAVIVTGGVGIGGALNVGGDIVAYASSDERLKDNIELISNPIEKVQSLKGVTWDWNSNADILQQTLPNVGVIAQDVEKILPQLVIDRDNGFKGVDYAKLTGLLIEAIKEQQKQIDDLKSKVK